MCGDFWINIPNAQVRGMCQRCEKMESLEHIFTECHDSTQATIWQLAEELWNRKSKIPWPTPLFGTQLGCGLINFKNSNGKRLLEVSCFYRILMSESMHLIWKMRCDWKIDKESNPKKRPTENETQHKQQQAINLQLKFECLMTNKNRYGKMVLSSSLVEKTWEGVLQNKENLPANWFMSTGVLVGRGVECP